MVSSRLTNRELDERGDSDMGETTGSLNKKGAEQELDLMAKLRIVRRGRFWALLEDGRGLNAFETKREAFEEMDQLRRKQRVAKMKMCQPRAGLPSETCIESRNELDPTLTRPKLV